MPARKNLDEAGILSAVLAGERHAAIAERFGCARSRVSQIARKHGYDSLAAYEARRAQKRAQRLGSAAPPATPKPVGRPPTEIPAWVSRADLSSDYRDFAREFDDERAARECRKLLADLRQQQALDVRLGRAA